jgi:hypothetical protein
MRVVLSLPRSPEQTAASKALFNVRLTYLFAGPQYF